jgi:isochorismate hydrolase
MSLGLKRIKRAQAVLLVVDIQEKLLPAMYEPVRVLQNAVRLAKGAQILGVPVWVTEQYRKGLGPTVPELASAISGFAPLEKMAFSALGAEGLRSRFRDLDIQQAIICGIESHVCVTQTCLDLLEACVQPFIVVDGVSSRSSEDCRVGLDRMRHAGAVMVSTEMVLFELLERAGTPEFKQVLPLVK